MGREDQASADTVPETRRQTRLARDGAPPGASGFPRALERAVARESIGRVDKDSDAIFVGATKTAQLAHLDTLKASLKSNGANTLGSGVA